MVFTRAPVQTISAVPDEATTLTRQNARAGSTSVFTINAVSTVLTRLIQMTVLVWVNQYLLLRVNVTEYSLYPIVMSLVVFADFFRGAFTGGLTRYLVEAYARNEHLTITRITSSMLPLFAIAGVVITILGVLVAWQIGQVVTIPASSVSDARIMLLLLVAMIVISFVTAPLVQGLHVRQRFLMLSAIELGCELLRVSLLLVLLLLVSAKVMWLVVAATASGCVSVFLKFVASRRLLPSAYFRKDFVSLNTARRLINFGVWTSLQGITELVSTAAPPLLLNRFSTSTEVAIFHLGRLPELQIRRLTSAATIPAQPILTSLHADGDLHTLSNLYFRGGRYHLWVALLLSAPLLAFGKELMIIYAGSQYAEAATVMSALLLTGPFFWACAPMFYRVAFASENIRSFYICEVTMQLVALCAILGNVGVARRGAGATAIAMAATIVAFQILVFWPMGLRLVAGSWSDFFRRTLKPGFLPFITALIVAYSWVALPLPLGPLTRIWIGTVTTICIYIVVLLTFCLQAEDHDLKNRLFRRLRRRSSSSVDY